ncbi:hypothetical protein L6164_025977 [Bauhinia variegata]|uniref:Uncharacterized protein n=1 Tax=Bauhinia variegata TaxID=167791 RepID=A0ACB9M4A6_BAUVA|nr:hypothetical protein L6164_025977 [Bauhinia variegata]
MMMCDRGRLLIKGQKAEQLLPANIYKTKQKPQRSNKPVDWRRSFPRNLSLSLRKGSPGALGSGILIGDS